MTIFEKRACLLELFCMTCPRSKWKDKMIKDFEKRYGKEITQKVMAKFGYKYDPIPPWKYEDLVKEVKEIE